MRELLSGSLSKEDFTRGGAPASYVIADRSGRPVSIEFQQSPNGFGATNEALLGIIIDRLEHFQKGEFPCHENEAALWFLGSAMEYLKARTNRRKNAGVEGKYEEMEIAK